MEIFLTQQFRFLAHAFLALLLGICFFPHDAFGAALSKPPNNLGLAGYWAFNEGGGTVATDFSGNANAGTLAGATIPTWVSGKRGRFALNFDGSTSKVTVPAATSLAVTTNFTVSAWVQRASSGTWDTIYDSGTQANHWKVALSNGNVLAFSEVGIADNTASTSIADTNWHHVAVVKSTDAGTNVTFYVDGVADGAVAVGSVAAPSGTLTIGTVSDNSDPFHGRLDEVRVYNRALSAAQVLALYGQGQVTIRPSIPHKTTVNASSTALARGGTLTNGLVAHWAFDGNDTVWSSATAAAITDLTGNGNSATTQTSFSRSLSPVLGKHGQALNFNGTAQWLSANDSTSLDVGDVFTYAMWFKRSRTSGVAYEIFASKGANTPVPLIEGSNDPPNAGKLKLAIYNLGIIMTSTTAVSDTGWHHAAFTKNGAAVNIYIDGVDRSGTITNQTAANNAVAQSIASESGGVNSWFGGALDDFRIYNRAITATEVQQLYLLGR